MKKEKNFLEDMFWKQCELQSSLLGPDFDIELNQEYINTMTIAAIDELMEALHETKWKPWKKKQDFNQEKFKEELIDAWHFLINLSLASGMCAQEVYERFINKNNINLERKKEGY